MPYQEKDILDLSRKSLKKVPKNILNNPNLRELNLSNNQLTELPDFITELRHLEVIKLRNNNFKTAPELVLQLRNLKSLSLSVNQIEVIPESFSRLTNLEKFDIGANPLIEFPKWINRLYVLKDLGIYSLNLDHLPEVVLQVNYLEILSLDDNNLATLPNSIDKLRYLKELWAEGNCFEYLPESFGNLHQLERVNFSFNNFKYFPKSICNLKRLEFLSISENDIRELPHNIGKLNQLTNLDLSYNQITSLPKSFSSLNIERLEVWFNGNPYNETTKRQIKSLFPEIDDSELEEEVFVSIKEKNTSQNTIQKDVDKSSFTVFFIFLTIIIIPVFFILLLKILDTEDPIVKTTKKANSEYNTVFTLYKKNRDSILKNNSPIYVYTNDTSKLKATFYPNLESYTSHYISSYSNTQSKTNALKKFLQDKSLGYKVILNNNRVRLIQAALFDSIYTDTSIKKYSLVVDYKMSKEEIELKKQRRTKYMDILNRRRDTVFNSKKIVLTSKELTDRKINNGFKRILSPIIDLNNKEYHFYFSSYDNNFSKQDFIKAVEDFKAMYLKTDKNGKIRELIIKAEEF